jgi:phage-related tail fiber protein
MEDTVSFDGLFGFPQVKRALGVADTSFSVNSQRITSLGTPTGANDAANKAYVDSVANGLDVKASVRAATTANITLSGAQTIDGVSVIAGDRVLVKNQTTGSANGLYLAAAGAWSRTTDADSSAEVTPGMFTFVEEGTVNADTGYVLVTDSPITLGTTSLSFSIFTNTGGITYGSPVAVGTANADGTATSVARSDHVHDLTETTFRAVAAELTASLNVNSQKITSLANGTAATDAAAFGQIPSTTVLTTATSATVVAQRYVEVTADAQTITLPASPSVGRHITINTFTGNTSTTINGNGNTINGSSTFVMNEGDQSVDVVYMSTEWRIV